MIEIDINEFTKKELIRAICRWIRESDILYSTPEIIANKIEDGSWIGYYNDIFEKEKRTNYQDGI